MRFKRVIGVVLVAGFAAGQAWSAAAADDLIIPRDERQAAPKLALKDLDGEKHLLGDLKGKVVVVNFWATWCAPCRVEMPEFTKVQQEYKDRGVEFIGAANERTSDKDKVVEFVRQYRDPVPNLDRRQHLSTGRVQGRARLAGYRGHRSVRPCGGPHQGTDGRRDPALDPRYTAG